MPDTKISALSSGAPAQAGDEYVIARSGANYKLTGTNLLGLVTGTANTFTAAQTFRAASAVRSEAASTQDAVVLAGRAGGTSSYAVTLTPTTLSGNRTLTLPDVAGTVLTTGATVTVAQGGTGLTSGTSGGVLAFTATGTLASSGALALNAIVIGGGAGAAPSTTTTGTGVLTAIGNAVNTSGGLVTQTGTLAANSLLLGGGSGTAIASTTTGANVVTWLGTPSSANLAAAVTDETGTGALVFANTPTLVTPVLGTPTSGNLSNCTADGTNAVGYRNIPRSGSAKTTSYTLVTGDVGEFIEVGSGGSVTIPDATFATGDVVSIFNNTSGNITITCTITTAYIAGTDADKASVTLATRGVATILFLSGTVCVISGNVS